MSRTRGYGSNFSHLIAGGGRQSGTVKIVFGSVLGKTSIADCIDDKHIFFVKQISDNSPNVRDQNHLLGNMRLPITAPSNKS